MTGPYDIENSPAALAKLLRAIAGGSDAQATKHDAIFNAAAEWLEILAELSVDEIKAFGKHQ